MTKTSRQVVRVCIFLLLLVTPHCGGSVLARPKKSCIHKPGPASAMPAEGPSIFSRTESGERCSPSLAARVEQTLHRYHPLQGTAMRAFARVTAKKRDINELSRVALYRAYQQRIRATRQLGRTHGMIRKALRSFDARTRMCSRSHGPESTSVPSQCSKERTRLRAASHKVARALRVLDRRARRVHGGVQSYWTYLARIEGRLPGLE